MTAERHGRWGYYRCGRNAYRKELCRSKFCNSDTAHRDVDRICRQVRLPLPDADAIRNEALRQIDVRLDAARTDRERIDVEQSRLLEQEIRLTEAFTAGDISPDVYKPKSAELRKRRSQVIAQLARPVLARDVLVNRLDEILKLATSLSDIYEQLPDSKRVELLQGVFETLVLGPEGVAGFTLKEPFDRIAKAAGTAQHDIDKADLANGIFTTIEEGAA